MIFQYVKATVRYRSSACRGLPALPGRARVTQLARRGECAPSIGPLVTVRHKIYRELVYRPLQFRKFSQLFINAHDEPLSVAMRVLVALSAVVENGCD